jgi:hypothetical protein
MDPLCVCRGPFVVLGTGELGCTPLFGITMERCVGTSVPP